MDAGVLGLIGVVVGAVLTGGLGVVREWLAQKSSDSARAEQRRIQLWETSLPAAGRAQKLFAGTMRGTRPLTFQPPREPRFEDFFDESWEETDPIIRHEIAMIPSQSFREALVSVVDGIEFNDGLTKKAGYAATSEETVFKLSTLGFDITSAWMRGEDALDESTHARVLDVENAQKDMEASFEAQKEQEES